MTCYPNGRKSYCLYRNYEIFVDVNLGIVDVDYQCLVVRLYKLDVDYQCLVVRLYKLNVDYPPLVVRLLGLDVDYYCVDVDIQPPFPDIPYIRTMSHSIAESFM